MMGHAFNTTALPRAVRRWPGLAAKAKSTAHKAIMWVRTHRRWADVESMLEVHF